MQWSEVFDKYFIIHGDMRQVLVFVSGSLKRTKISWYWTTIAELESGTQIPSVVHDYLIDGDSPSDLFKDWRPIVKLSQEERICKKINVMEGRWKKFQEKKKVPVTIIKDTPYEFYYYTTPSELFVDSF